MHTIFSLITISSLIVTPSALADFSFKTLYHKIIPPKLYEETVYEKINPKSASLLTVKNECGNVNVSVDSHESLVSLKVTKKSPEPDRLPQLCYKHAITGQELLIEHAGEELKEHESVDFEIIAPQKLTQSLKTTRGNISTKDMATPTCLSTTHGSIEVCNAHNRVDAISQEKGAITFTCPHALVKAQTNTGNITIYDSYHSVIASTTNGAIKLYAKEVPSTSIINLSSVSGTIATYLPPEVNADVQAFTKQGTVTSDHFITLKQKTTQLNRNTWKQLQKEVEGTLGSGEARISLSSVKSDIKMMELKTS